MSKAELTRVDTASLEQTPSYTDFCRYGHAAFRIMGETKPLETACASLNYTPFKLPDTLPSKGNQVATSLTGVFDHPLFLPNDLRKMYWQLRRIGDQLGHPMNVDSQHKHMRFMVNRCQKGYYQDWHVDDDGVTQLIVLLFVLADEYQEEYGGKFEIKRNISGVKAHGWSYAPFTGLGIVLDPKRTDWRHRGEEWRSDDYIRYFVRLCWVKNGGFTSRLFNALFPGKECDQQER